MKLLISVFLSLLIFIPMSHGREIIGSSIYEMKSQRKKLLFTSQFERRVSEGKEIETVKVISHWLRYLEVLSIKTVKKKKKRILKKKKH